VHSLKELEDVAAACKQHGIQFYLWIEMPENYPTAIATKPYTSSQLKFLQSLALFS
jgi:hypothetical protein